MHLPIVEVRNRKTHAGIFCKCVHSRMCINKISRRLFPYFGIGHNIVEMTL